MFASMTTTGCNCAYEIPGCRWDLDTYYNAGYGGFCLLGPTHPAKLYAELPVFWEEEVAYIASKSNTAPVLGH